MFLICLPSEIQYDQLIILNLNLIRLQERQPLRYPGAAGGAYGARGLRELAELVALNIPRGVKDLSPPANPTCLEGRSMDGSNAADGGFVSLEPLRILSGQLVLWRQPSEPLLLGNPERNRARPCPKYRGRGNSRAKRKSQFCCVFLSPQRAGTPREILNPAAQIRIGKTKRRASLLPHKTERMYSAIKIIPIPSMFPRQVSPRQQRALVPSGTRNRIGTKISPFSR